MLAATLNAWFSFFPPRMSRKQENHYQNEQMLKQEQKTAIACSPIVPPRLLHKN